MGDKAKAWTRKNVEDVARAIADKAIAEFEEGRNSPTGVGCGSTLGSLALKKHELYHKLKLNSDLHNLLAFKDAQLEENGVVTRALSESAQSMSLATLNFENMISKYNDLKNDVKDNESIAEKKRDKQDDKINKFDLKLWGIAAAIVIMCIGTVWNGSKLKTINSVDRSNQKNTELYMAMLVSNLSGKPLDKVKKEFEEMKEEKKKNKEGGD